MDDWIHRHAAAIAARAPRELEALVAVSSPSGDVHGAEEAAAVAAALAPGEADVERIPCSSPDHAPDLLIRLAGTGTKRIVLVGHLDTVVSHAEHRPLRREDDRLVGSGTVDMKGGDVLALGVLRALVDRRADIAEAALLLVCDEEWRVGPFAHVSRFRGFDACLCFEGGQQTEAGDDAVIVKRKAAATVRVVATGRSSHSGSAPDRGINALLALAGAAQAMAACHDPAGEDHLTAVPTVIRAGEAFNVVPGAGELICDVRADTLGAFARVIDAVPADIGGARLEATLMREWPGMDAREATAGLLRRASAAIGRAVVAEHRGGASDASHFASEIPLTVDGLGPRGGGAHAPHEYVLASGLRPRAEVALAIADAVLAG
ncbi:MAG: glutamate carboxypeptidase [Solirubrobacteraceae bacterium]|nr:glutamate carboxypeptidase [Solirubrobacteraceae bacterium]